MLFHLLNTEEPEMIPIYGLRFCDTDFLWASSNTPGYYIFSRIT